MTHALPNAADVLAGGPPSFSWTQVVVGGGIEGTLTCDPETRQSTKMGTGEPDTWTDGKPKFYVAIQLQTSLRDIGGDDDGERTLNAGPEMIRAIRQALGRNRMGTGDWLKVTLVGREPNKVAGFSPKNLFRAEWRPTAQQSAAVALQAPPTPLAATEIPRGWTQPQWDALPQEHRTAILRAQAAGGPGI